MTTIRWILGWGLGLGCCLPPGLAAEPPQGATLTVQIAKPLGDQGEFLVAVFTKPEGFPMDLQKADRRAVARLNEPKQTFTNLPPGDYVILVVQDRNRNGKLDRYPLGIPKEPIGLSNYPKIDPKQGRPDFDKAKVTVRDETTVEITLTEILR